ncbi:MAG: AAA family ATPase, partial [Woeseiaceae bacterium]
MYEEHFGLKKRPFSVKATGTEVFVGPQTAKTMAGFRKALAVQDAVVTVSGPVGTGKTTLVERALDAIGTKYKTIRVGRMQMNSSDVLESLLVVLGVQDRPTGTIQRFAALRKKLKELQDAETRVFILVEDAMRAGAETLAELEALTVADAGESDGASIVLMGDERLFDFMRDPQLARLQQRIRQRHKIKALCIAEMLGYLKHSFRMAGGDYERVFDARSAELIHLLSDGIPRIANNLVDSVLVAAAAKRMDKIPATFIANVASDEFGMSAEGFDFSTPEPVAEHMPDPAVDAVAEPAPEPVPVVDETEPTISAEPQPVIVFAEDAEQPPEQSQDVPHLIQDTLPDLAILSKRYATLLQDDAGVPPEVVANVEDELAGEILPELVPEPNPAPEPVASDTPDSVPEPILEPEPAAEIIPELVPEPEPAAEIIPAPKPDPTPVAEIITEFEPEPEPVAEIIPELEPEMEPAANIFPEPEPEPETTPELVADFAREFEPGPVIALEDAAEIIPELAPEPEPVDEPEPVAESI